MSIHISYTDIIAIPNLLQAWREFALGKRHKKDVAEFSMRLSEEIAVLHEELASKAYQHGPYAAFSLCDPKPRSIHKALVRDRLLHHAVYRILYIFFESRFVYDSYSCRNGRGTHKAIRRFELFARRVSKNNTRTCWVLQCDVKKFFASIDHALLSEIVARHGLEPDTLWLIQRIVTSFSSGEPGKGLPLGNLTSQLLVNVYMNELDQWMKHEMRVKHYIRYADDFVIFNEDRAVLEEMLPKIDEFLWTKLKLTLHPNKVHIQTVASGVDFLGWVHFPDHRVLRTVTKRRMTRKLKETEDVSVVNSYKGLMSHGNTRKLAKQLFPR